jgi:hypothetical protein
VEQIKKAAEEAFNDRRQKSIQRHQEIFKFLRETELLADEVDLGPAIIRVEDAIPVSGAISLAPVSRIQPCNVSLGLGTVLEPVYLVIDVLDVSNFSDSRFGVFKICMYELIKRALVAESEGNLNFTVTLENDSVYLGTGDHTLCLV